MVSLAFGSDSFPSSLDLQKIRQGDNCAVSDLLAHLGPYIERVASRFAMRGTFNHEELSQAARIAGFTAARSYQEGNGSFCAYVGRAMSNAVYEEGRKAKLVREKERLVDWGNTGSERRHCYFGLWTEHREFGEIDCADALPVIRVKIWEWRRRLSPQKNRVLELIFYRGMSQSQAAREMGLTRSRISKIVQGIVESGKIGLSGLGELN